MICIFAHNPHNLHGALAFFLEALEWRCSDNLDTKSTKGDLDIFKAKFSSAEKRPYLHNDFPSQLSNDLIILLSLLSKKIINQFKLQGISKPKEVARLY